MSSAKWRPPCLGLNTLMEYVTVANEYFVETRHQSLRLIMYVLREHVV